MPFKQGQSGNVKGRPRGVQDRRAVFRTMVEPNANQLLQKAIDMALEGNEPMLRLLLDRVMPAKLRDDPISIDIIADTLVGKTTKIINELSAGNITPAVAKTLMDMVATEVKILEFDVLAKRVTEIEQAMKDPFPDKGWTEE